MGIFHGLRSNHGAIFPSGDLIPGVYFMVGIRDAQRDFLPFYIKIYVYFYVSGKGKVS